jgi:hypothetical protein
MNVDEITTIVAMVMSVLPVMWISYLYYRLEIKKLQLSTIQQKVESEQDESRIIV